MSNEESFTEKPLKKRSRAHRLGDPRFYCTYPDCPKSFTRKEHLRRHERTHENVKAFSCSFCNRAFARSDVLNRHVQQMHLQKQNLSERLPPPQFFHSEAGERPTPSVGAPSSLASSMDSVRVAPSMLAASHQIVPQFSENNPRVSNEPPRVTIENASLKPFSGYIKSHMSTSNFLNGEPDLNVNVDLSPFPNLPATVPITQAASTANAFQQPTNQFQTQKLPSGLDTRPVSSYPDELTQLESNPDSFSRLDLQGDCTCIFKNRSSIASSRTMDDVVRWLFSSGKRRQKYESSYPYQTQSNQIPSQDQYSDTDSNFLSYYFSASGPMYVPQKCPATVYNNLLNFLEDSFRLQPNFLAMFTLESVSSWLNAYWSMFHVRWPILHRGTFQITQAPLDLLLSMITLGMHSSNDLSIRSLAVEIHTTLRYNIYQKQEFGPPVSLWVYQALFLIQVFELFTSNLKQHRLAQMFHPVLIEAMRQAIPSDALTVRSETFGESNTPLTLQQWHKWITRESVKRIAFFVFALDSTSTLVFGNQPLLYVTDVSMPLLAEEHHWEAENFEVWAAQKPTIEPPTILHMLKAFVQCESPLPKLSPWNMLLLLHGLLSVDISLKQKKFVPGMKLSKREIDGWCSLVFEAYQKWNRCYYSIFLNNNILPFGHPFVKECRSLYNLACIYSKTRLTYLQAFAKAVTDPVDGSVTSKTVAPLRYVKIWANTENARYSTSNALEILDMLLREKIESAPRYDTLIYHSWCYYVAALVLWSIGFALDEENKKTEEVTNLHSQMSRYVTKVRQALEQGEPLFAVVEKSKNPIILHVVLQALDVFPWDLLGEHKKIIQQLLSKGND